jgi:hypothetical protein
LRDNRRDFIRNGTETDPDDAPPINDLWDGFKFNRDVVERAKAAPAASHDGWGWPYANLSGCGFSPLRQLPEYDNYGTVGDWKCPLMPIGLAMKRSLVNLEPTISQGPSLSQMLLSHCASFKVEWAFEVPQDVIEAFDTAMVASGDPGLREVLWIDPGEFASQIAELDRRAGVAMTPCLSTNPPDDRFRWYKGVREKLLPRDPVLSSSPPAALPFDGPNPADWVVSRFLSVSNLNGVSWKPLRSHVFYSSRPYPAAANCSSCQPEVAPDPLFPKALRITVDVYDAANRLHYPIRHVMVLPVGKG